MLVRGASLLPQCFHPIPRSAMAACSIHSQWLWKKIKDMHYAYISCLWLSLLSYGSMPGGRGGSLISYCELFPFLFCSIFSPPCPLGPPPDSLDMVYSLETSLSLFSDPIFNGPLNQDDSLYSVKPRVKLTSWQAALSNRKSYHQRAAKNLNLPQRLSET